MFDESKWKSALTYFDGFVSGLPPAPTDEDVFQYHSIIGLFENAGDADLSQFRISPERILTDESTTILLPRWRTRHPKKTSIDPRYFRQQVRRLVEHLRTSLNSIQ